MVVLRGDRVVLRPWRAADKAAFRRMGANPRVMEFLPGLLDAPQSDALADRIAGALDRRGWGWWALEVPGVAEFGGFVGLNRPAAPLPFAPCVEIGWRLDPALWGRFHATEAARACLDHAFGALGLPEVVAFTVPANTRSRAVMARIGMTRDPAGDFDHPALPTGHPLRPHVLYRMKAP